MYMNICMIIIAMDPSCKYCLLHFIFVIKGSMIQRTIKIGLDNAKKYYKNDPKYKDELENYNRLFEDSFKNADINDIKSSGYVVDTLEGSIGCLLNTNSYKDCVLKGVNLGDDTDTIAAIASGLGGIFYGYESIWVEVVGRRELGGKSLNIVNIVTQ